MMINSDITLYYSFYNRETKVNEYKKVYLQGVNLQINQVVSVGDKGLNSADKVTVFIPFDVDSEGKEYIKPIAYKGLDNSLKDRYFTFKAGDKIVEGFCDLEPTSINIKDLEKLYDDVYSIISVATNDYGSPSMHHWEVGCK